MKSTKITLLVTSFNSLTQAVYVWLRDRGYVVGVVYAKSLSMLEEIESFEPDLVLCPFLKDYVPSSIYDRYDTFVFHPGIRGDRGAYSLEWALWESRDSWGGVWLRVVEELDSGDIYASGEFKLRDSYKASIYRNEELKTALNSLEELLQNIKSNSFVPQLQKPMHPKFQTTIDWHKDTTKEIIKKINTLDSFPGVLDEILGIECHLFGVHNEAKLRGNKPKEILAKRDGAICISTIDGALWITHLREPHRFKLPATYVLKSRLQGIKEHRLPLIFDRSYETFYEISCDMKGDVAYLHFDFHNGAFSSDKCIKLKYAFEYLKQQAKVIVLMGGLDFFSNGIHLNILEDSKKDGEDGWGNINAMNDLVGSVLMCDDVITVASLSKNAGAGGVFLALACDYVVCSDLCVLNPHYKTLGLSGSEYHTFTLPKRVGEKMATKLLDECLPISSQKAKEIGMVDEVFGSNEYLSSLEEFAQGLVEDEDRYDDMLWDKQDFLEANQDKINECKQQELATMHPEFWDEDSIFHTLRYEFVYKICPTQTPKRLMHNS